MHHPSYNPVISKDAILQDRSILFKSHTHCTRRKPSLREGGDLPGVTHLAGTGGPQADLLGLPCKRIFFITGRGALIACREPASPLRATECFLPASSQLGAAAPLLEQSVKALHQESLPQAGKPAILNRQALKVAPCLLQLHCSTWLVLICSPSLVQEPARLLAAVWSCHLTLTFSPSFTVGRLGKKLSGHESRPKLLTS